MAGLGLSPRGIEVGQDGGGGTDLSGLANGLVKITTGVAGTAVAGTDYIAPNVTTVGVIITASSTSLTSCPIQKSGDPNTGISFPGGADTVAMVAGGTRCVQTSFSGSTAQIDLGSTAANTFFQLVTDSRTWAVQNSSFAGGDDVFCVQNIGTSKRAFVVSPANDNVAVCNAAALDTAAVLATNATGGHFLIPTCGGAPTGAAPNGAIIIDTTNSKLYLRIGGAWVGGTVPGVFV